MPNIPRSRAHAHASGAQWFGRGGVVPRWRRCGSQLPRVQAQRLYCTDETPSHAVATLLWVAAGGHHIAPPCCGGDGTREQPWKDTIEAEL